MPRETSWGRSRSMFLGRVYYIFTIVWRVCNQGPQALGRLLVGRAHHWWQMKRLLLRLEALGREGAPLMASEAFAVALTWMHIWIRCPMIQSPLPRVHNKTTKINWSCNGLTLQELFPWTSNCDCLRPLNGINSRQDVRWPAIIAPWAQ